MSSVLQTEQKITTKKFCQS